MTNILNELVQSAEERAKSLVHADLPVANHECPSFIDSLRGKSRVSLIAEIKQRSPSHGEFGSQIPPVERALLYERCGASAISVLTEPTHFGGSYELLHEVAAKCAVPVLMKDFIVHEKQLEAAARIGAAGVLLIMRVLGQQRVSDLLETSSNLKLDALVECHDALEVEAAVHSGARIVGINNRNLDTLQINSELASDLAHQVPKDVVLIAESGYQDGAAVQRLSGCFDGVLIGGALMNAQDVEARVREFVQ